MFKTTYASTVKSSQKDECHQCPTERMLILSRLSLKAGSSIKFTVLLYVSASGA